MTNERLSTLLSRVKQRCYNKNDPSYNNYGGKGIKVCEDWLVSSKNFFKWAKENGYEDKFVLRRKDIEKDYSPENCYWISPEEGRSIRLGDRIIEWNGEKLTCSQWDKKLDYVNGTVKTRIGSGWSIEEALTIPQYGYRNKEKMSHNAKKIKVILPNEDIRIYNSITEASRDLEISTSTLMSLIKEPNKKRRKYNNYKVSFVGNNND